MTEVSLSRFQARRVGLSCEEQVVVGRVYVADFRVVRVDEGVLGSVRVAENVPVSPVDLFERRPHSTGER